MRGPRSLRGATGHKARSGKLCIEGCYDRAEVLWGGPGEEAAGWRLEAGRRRQEVVLPWVHVWSTMMSDRFRSVCTKK